MKSPHTQEVIVSLKRDSRYYLLAGGITLLAVIALVLFWFIWPSRLPNSLINSRTTWIMNFSGIIFSIVILLAILTIYRESQGIVILTNKSLLICPRKQMTRTTIPLEHIKRIELGHSPLEKLSRCGSLWLTLQGEPAESHLIGPFKQEQVICLKQILEKELKKT